jgi:hypothetical protein
MKNPRFLFSCIVLLLALLAGQSTLQAAKKKARTAPKEHPTQTFLTAQPGDFQTHVEREISSLKEDVYTRATWQKLQEVKQQADETAGKVKLVTWCAALIGFVLGCAVTFVFARRMGRPDDSLKIT